MAVNSTDTKPRPEPASRTDSAARTRPAAHGGRRPEAPVAGPVIAGTRPRRSASAADTVLAYLRIQAGLLTSLEPQVRADEPDSVHQMRVATRRLRATFRTFGSVIPPSASEHVAAELKWLGALLGAARDAEVLPARLQATLAPTPPELLIGPVQARVQGHFPPVRAAARVELIQALDSPRFARLLADLDLLTREPPGGPKADAPAHDVLPAAVRKVYRQASKRIRRARHTPVGPARDTALHQARKSARRARYAAEAAAPAAGHQARTFAGQMKRVQSVLGEHQDSVLARRASRDLGIGAHLAGENAFTYGLLHEREAHQAQRLQARARHTWAKASRPRYRHWMP